MILGKGVRPKKWSDVQDLFDDGVNSFIVGYYEDLDDDCIGIRWDGDKNDRKNLGFPRHGNYPTWFVLPKMLNKQILRILKEQVTKNPSFGNLTNIESALKRLS